ncbi:MAG TPA: hypothetical protein P5292_01945 [Bacteroidia bacterium]|nr:hypothetical protein [Bacteroidia bacterium]
MITRELDLIGELTSPLFRILWTHDADEPARRQFENNIVAFHIGKGYILTVAHNLRSEAPLIKSLPDAVYQAEIRPRLPDLQRQVFEQLYPLDQSNGRRYPRLTAANDARNIGEFLRQNNIDTRWITLMRQQVCRPQLILQFKHPEYFGDAKLAAGFSPTRRFHEPAINRHTFLVDLELVKHFFAKTSRFTGSLICRKRCLTRSRLWNRTSACSMPFRPICIVFKVPRTVKWADS